MNEANELAELLVKNALGLEWNLESNPEKVKAVTEALKAIASQPVIDGFYLYLLIIKDIYGDDKLSLYTSSEPALKAANEYIIRKSRYVFESEWVDNDPEWLFCMSAQFGDYIVTVRRVKVEG